MQNIPGIVVPLASVTTAPVRAEAESLLQLEICKAVGADFTVSDALFTFT